VIVDLGLYKSIIIRHKKLIKSKSMQSILNDLGYDKNDFLDGLKDLLVVDIIPEKENGSHWIFFSFKSEPSVIHRAQI